MIAILIIVKFNFSHNGTTISDPLNFNDLNAFGNNNFTKELNDLDCVLNWISLEYPFFEISLIGHSRGGGISLIKSAEDNRINKVISWASPSNFLNRIPDTRINIWKQKGVVFVYNGRTKQNMPLYLQFYNDCMANKERLNIENSVSSSSVPLLVIHGSEDYTVLVNEAQDLHNWSPNSELFIVSGADHVFGGSHPYNLGSLPLDLQRVVDKTIDFINQ